MSNPKQLLVSCITLLCLENREDSPADPSTDLINEVIGSLQVRESTIDIDHGRQTTMDLKNLVIDLNKKNKFTFPSLPQVLQSVQVCCREEGYLYDAVKTAIEEEFPNGMAVMLRITSYRNTLNSYLSDEKVKAIVKECSQKIIFNNGSGVDVPAIINELATRVDPYIRARADERHPAEMGYIDFGDLDNLEEIFDEAKTILSPDGAFRTGWKGLNRMLGKLGALKRGEFIIGGALQHQYKTGVALSLFSHVCLFNKPYMRDTNKKPLILFITLENELPDNLLQLYEYIFENETGIKVDRTAISKREASEYVSARLKENGFEPRMHRFDPTDFTISGLIQFLDNYQAKGYEIQYLCVDYLNMLPKTGLDAKVAGDDIRLLFRRLRNYTAPRGITFFSPHQLSSDALQLTRENVEDFVKLVANKGYYDGCRRLGQEPDLEIFFHIVKLKGKSYLTVQRGKHRNTVTSDKYQYVVLPFEPNEIGGIRWDVDKEENNYLDALPNLHESVNGEDAWGF